MSSEDPGAIQVTNQKRQALPPLRGYDYQIWQSLNRWLSLGASEVLFLEVAEDLDVLRAGEAETVQVKETRRAGTVTLNSRDIVEAIAHFWEHQKNNPGYTVRFRFLTTSERGSEQPNNFGGMRGLDYWDRCRRPDTELGSLRSFLSSLDKLPSDLRDFVSAASDDEFREKLIKRIEWDTGQKDKAYIEELVTQKVVYYGTHVYALQHSEAVMAVAYLFKHIWSVILQEDNRRLTYSDFTRLLEEYSTVRVPKRVLQLRAASFALMPTIGLENSLEGGGKAFNLVSDAAPESYALPSFDRLAKREDLVAELQVRLNSQGVLVLRGSSGMGKSTLAGLIAAKDRGKWRRFDLRDLKAEQIRGQLFYASLDASEHPSDTDYIVDDLNFDDRPSLYERALAGFIYTVTSRGGRMIITTQGELPERLLLAFDLSNEVVFDVPRLTEEEIGQVALNYGCPQGKTLETWQRVIHGNTLGHPLLVHARVKNVASSGWPKPRLDDLFKPEGVEGVRREVLRRLKDQLPSEQARTLAYRLSIFTGYFKRNHAQHLALPPPALSSPGEALDQLIGPWVERLGHGYHRLSPLLAGSASQMFGEEEVKNLHKTAAYAYLTQNTLTPTELGGALFHGLLGEIPEPIIAAASATFSIKDTDWPVISRELDWLTSVAIEPGQKLFKVEPLASLTLRAIQFKVAAEIDSSGTAPAVVASWEAELDSLDEYKELPLYTALRMLSQFLFNQVIFRFEVPLPVKTVVNNIARAITLDLECKASAASGNEISQEVLRERPEVVADFDTEIFVAVARCKNADHVDQFLDALEALVDEAADVFWAQFRNNETATMNFISSAWLPEIKEQAPNWQRTLEVLDRAAELALEKGADALFAHAYCAKAILIREYMPERDSEAAVKLLADGDRKLGYRHPALQDYLAKLYMLDGRHSDALEVWRKIPANTESGETGTRLFTYREALICAGNLGDWNLVAEYALKGERAAHRLAQDGEIIAVGFLVEHAFALWKSEEVSKSLAAFSKIIEALAKLPEANENIRSYALHVAVLHTIRWIERGNEISENFYEPNFGDFTIPNVDEKYRDKPIPPYVFYWRHLAGAEYKYNVGDLIFQRFEEECNKLNLPIIKFQVEQLRLLHSLRKLDLAPLINKFSEYWVILKAVPASANSPAPPSFDTHLIISLLFAALVKLVSLGRHSDAPLKQWRADAQSNGLLNESLEFWFDYVERCIEADENDLLDIMKDPELTPEARAVAALVLSSSISLHPDDRFVANSLLLNAAHAYSLWGQEIELPAEGLIIKGWERTIKEQRFALSSPSATTPAILKACQDSSVGGLKKGSRILLAVSKAVGTRLPEDLINKLIMIAE